MNEEDALIGVNATAGDPMKCFQCAKEIVELPINDPTRVSTRYSYAPAFVVEVLPGGPGGGPGSCRATVLCWTCMHELDIDMWLSEEGWNGGKPSVPFEQLPTYNHDDPVADEPQTYTHGASTR
jgi:hypothetical protein